MNHNFLTDNYRDFADGKIDVDKLLFRIKEAEKLTSNKYIFPLNNWLSTGGTYSALLYSCGVILKRFEHTKEDYAKLLKALQYYDFNGSFLKRAMEHWPNVINIAQSNIEKIKEKSTKLPNKSLKLKEWVKTLKEMEYNAFNYINKNIDYAILGKTPWTNVYITTMGNMYYLTTDEAIKLYERLKKLNATGSLVNIDSKKMLSELLTYAKPIETSQNNINQIKKGATKLPHKSFKL
jgi:hypothetical protein